MSAAARGPPPRSVSTAGRTQAPAPELLVPLNGTSSVEPQVTQAPPKAVTSELVSGFDEDYFQVQSQDTKTGAV